MPIEAESASIVPGQLVPIQAVDRNPDGTLKSVQQRTLTIATTKGEHVLVFPRAVLQHDVVRMQQSRDLDRDHAFPADVLRQRDRQLDEMSERLNLMCVLMGQRLRLVQDRVGVNHSLCHVLSPCCLSRICTCSAAG